MRDRTFAGGLLVPVTLAVVVSYGRLVAEASDVPTDRELDDAARAAAAPAAASTADGSDDVIVLLPPWSMRPLRALGDDARRVVGADGPAAELLAGRYRSVTAIVEPDAEAWRPVLGRLGPPTSTTTFGAVTVERFAGGGPASFDLLRALPRARVTLDGEPCTEPVERGAVVGLHCDGEPGWQSVTREHALVTENGRLVVKARPPAPGRRLVIAVDDVALGDELVVAAGHTRSGAERAHGDVVVDVVIDDRVMTTLRRSPSFVVEPSRAALRAAFVRPPADDGEGFRADVIDTHALRGPRRRLAFIVRAETSAEHQDFALDAFARTTPPGAAR